MERYISNAVNLDEFIEIAKIRNINTVFAIDEETKTYNSVEDKIALYKIVIESFSSEDDIYDFTDENPQYQNRVEDELVFLFKKNRK
ncbi:hypothetical protein [Aliarcobacter lanthieri]|uniref:hypothetical protein n=1 Tax=Aliarcobacter lanthieri TaxID=1355374 RepID=UPI003AAD8193